MRHKIITMLAYIKSKFILYHTSVRHFFQKLDFDFSEISFNVIVISITGFLLLYYPLGALLTDKIDRNTDIEINATGTPQSQTVDMISYLINQEVNEKIWTPNLPFFFPAAILDNMPNYQLGMIDGISKFTTAFEKKVDSKIHDKENTSHLYKAGVLLRYPGTIWMFSPTNKIKPVPSASSQYRRAKRALSKYNQSLISGKNTFYKSPQDLSFILQKSALNLAQSCNQLTASIRENSSNLFDFKADDVFYYNQGKVYAYYMLIKALGYDYKNVIVDYNLYPKWISLVKSLEKACKIQPAIVRNGQLNSSFSPNHLAYLNLYILKAQSLIYKISQQLNQPLPAKDQK
ncbi:MAG: DUF2333 family protein [Alphaproteobacteria bacterium]|nr:DUF2333 family protein [Alphaproteobacteria bacterium]MBQ8677937.1 DUF2333 family protein [Alphaproteobacteria bacterium]